MGKRDFNHAKKLIQESGYKDEKIVIISASDTLVTHSQSLVTAELFRRLGLNVEVQTGDWGTLITRRTSKEPVDKGGWSIFHTSFAAPDISSPAATPLVSSGGSAWFGWPADKKLEELREAWFSANDEKAAKRAADEMQLEAYKFVPYIPTAQFIIPTAYRSNLSGLIVAPVVFLWNVEKK
jgi:peptide/nickel transport system substrate-binding protein